MELCKACPIALENCPRGANSNVDSQECEPRKRWKEAEQLFNGVNDLYHDIAIENVRLKDKLATLTHELDDWKCSLRGMLSQRITKRDLIEVSSALVIALEQIHTGKAAINLPATELRKLVEHIEYSLMAPKEK